MTSVTSAEDLIPETPPAYGQETAQVVLDITSQFPEQHLQQTWGMEWYIPGKEVCGTAACVAGWTWLVHGRSIADMTFIDPDRNDDSGHPMAGFDFAAKALGIGYFDAAALFQSSLPEWKAREALSYLAKGDKIDWAEINAPQPGKPQWQAPRISWTHG